MKKQEKKFILQGWLGNKDTVVHAGEGPVHIARWAGLAIAWANNAGVRVSTPVSLICLLQIKGREVKPHAMSNGTAAYK